jgi:Na+/melibiose symporter-like transporter
MDERSKKPKIHAGEASKAAAAKAAPRTLTHPEIRTIVLGIMLTMFLAALDQTIVATALPTIGRRFNNLDDLSWVVTAYLLTGTASTPLYGKLSDIYGRRGIMLLAIVIFILGSVACAMHDLAGVGARAAGTRRRRPDGADADHHRRHREPA